MTGVLACFSFQHSGYRCACHEFNARPGPGRAGDFGVLSMSMQYGPLAGSRRSASSRTPSREHAQNGAGRRPNLAEPVNSNIKTLVRRGRVTGCWPPMRPSTRATVLDEAHRPRGHGSRSRNTPRVGVEASPLRGVNESKDSRTREWITETELDVRHLTPRRPRHDLSLAARQQSKGERK